MAIFSHMAPVPPGFKPKWRDFLEEHVALYRRMPEELTLCVEELVPWFIKKVTWKWEPWVGPKPDEEMAKVCVSFLACLLIVNRSKKDLEHFHTFVFHPASLKDDDGKTWAGWANSRGYIEQSWPSTLRGMQDGEDNHCTTIHEFVHMIDYRERSFESVPHFDSSSAIREYRAFLKSEYKDLCKAWEKVSGCAAIRKYATSDKAEFLTCATESFFENSERLKFLRPQVYRWMQRIYKMDPRQWAERNQWAERVSIGELRHIRNYQWEQWDFKTTWDSKKNLTELLWPEGVPAKDYPWRARIERESREAAERATREKKEKEERERKEREAEENRLEKEERERREEAERKWRERYLLNNRTVIVEYPNGTPQLKYKLVDGHREGLMQRWDEQGNLREETEYSRGRKQGMITYYYPDGQKEMVGFYILDERAGLWRGWHEDGTKSFQSRYRDGQLHQWKQYRHDGTDQTYSRAKNRFGR
jgi:Mlc titration factor MtfA (ptsG expression regulator)/antitoxin component YwqK of YwqJK toxin-antitoxin module